MIKTIGIVFLVIILLLIVMGLWALVYATSDTRNEEQNKKAGQKND